MSRMGDAHPVPGSVLLIRDEEWLVTRAERASDGEWFVTVQGVSELVRDTSATFSTALDEIQLLDPAQAEVVADESPGYRRSRLWLEAMARKTAVPITDLTLTVATHGLADNLPYQLTAVRKALSAENLRPRILLADAVGLGKTLEIGMILAELVRRGRGERILVVTPRHVLEQMQFEMWTRFALPFVRLDSVGIQRIRQKLPGNRNPFAHFKRVIISIDTLKSDRYINHLKKQHWDAVVIDESHNVTGASQNNRLARLLSARTDALVLASATPHNGRKESFAELIRMLEPSAVTPEGDLVEEEVQRLVIRRHRHSEEVASYVGGDWAERLPPDNQIIKASAIENEIARELDEVWLHPTSGESPYSGSTSLFPWTLTKAFLSSPAALLASASERRKRLGTDLSAAEQAEETALKRLEDLAQRGLEEPTAKYDALRAHLTEIGVGKGKTTRAVVFAERVPTLHFLREKLCADLGLKEEAVAVLHGGLTDIDQQSVVESFKLESSPIRILVTGDVASEGVNLHLQCHNLIHYDIPWSLIRIQQRNGRVDRYGQKHRPRITTLLLDPDVENSLGDLRVLTRLAEREHEAHKALGDSAALIGKHDVKAEEEEIRKVLAGQQNFEDTVKEVGQVGAGDSFDDLFARLIGEGEDETEQQASDGPTTVYDANLDFLRDTLDEVLETPGRPWPDGVSWKEEPNHQIADLAPSPDLRKRLEVLPQSYIKDRGVTEQLRLATTLGRGQASLEAARGAGQHTLWPEAHYLSPLHPVLEWAADRALAQLGRNRVFAVLGPVDEVAVLLHGTLSNRRGQVVASSFLLTRFVGGGPGEFAMSEPHPSLRSAMEGLGIATDHVNSGAPVDLDELAPYVTPAVHQARETLSTVVDAAEKETRARVKAWADRVAKWDEEADALTQRAEVRERRSVVSGEKEIAESLMPDQQLVRPLLVVVPKEGAK